MVTATFLTEDSYLGSQTEPLTLNRYNYCVSSYLNYTDPSGNEVEVLESLKGWIIDPDTQAQKTIENYENQRLSLEDAIESGLLNNRAGQIFLDYGDVIMGPPVTLPSSLVGIREAIKGNFDSKEMQRTATAGFYAGFVGQGIEYTRIISKADYQLSLLIVTQKGLNAAANPLTYVEYFRNFSPQEKLEAAKTTAKGAWNGEYDSALGRKTGAAILDYLLVAIGGALMKGESAACEVAESGSFSKGVGNPVEVVGRGSTGRTVPNTLNEQMAMHQVMSNPLEGAVDMSQLKNHPVIMSDSRWLASEGWVKMSNNVNGVEIHFVYNKITGAFDDFKFK